MSMNVYSNRIAVEDRINVGASFIDGSGVGELGDDVS
jgi:hypothetical protein